jgi:hypothetical protein
LVFGISTIVKKLEFSCLNGLNIVKYGLDTGASWHMPHVYLEPISVIKVRVLCDKVALCPSTKIKICSANNFKQYVPPVSKCLMDFFLLEIPNNPIIIVVEVQQEVRSCILQLRQG